MKRNGQVLSKNRVQYGRRTVRWVANHHHSRPTITNPVVFDRIARAAADAVNSQGWIALSVARSLVACAEHGPEFACQQAQGWNEEGADIDDSNPMREDWTRREEADHCYRVAAAICRHFGGGWC